MICICKFVHCQLVLLLILMLFEARSSRSVEGRERNCDASTVNVPQLLIKASTTSRRKNSISPTKWAAPLSSLPNSAQYVSVTNVFFSIPQCLNVFHPFPPWFLFSRGKKSVWSLGEGIPVLAVS